MTRRLLLLLWTSLLQLHPALQSRVRVSPDQSQFFRGNGLNLRCDSSSWKVWRAGARLGGPCGDKWGLQGGSRCVLKILQIQDSGRYWCQSAFGERSEISSITVTDNTVILQMTTLPVESGQKVDLICNHHTSPNLPAHFYRNTRALSGQSGGKLTLQQVALSDAGEYRCEMGGVSSQPAHLQVYAAAVPSTRAAPPSSAPPTVTPEPSLPWFVIPVAGSIVGVVLLIVLVMLVVVMVRKCRCKKTKGSRAKRRKGRTPPPQNQKTPKHRKPHTKKKRSAPK